MEYKKVQHISNDIILLTDQIRQMFKAVVDNTREYKNIDDFIIDVAFIDNEYVVIYTWKDNT